MIEQTAKKIQNNIEKVISGKQSTIKMLTASLFCGGHILLEDIPGTGKTTLALACAKSVGGSFGRIQFTPDLLPSDITGVNFYSAKNEEFTFKKGPAFCSILLADEINRAAPRTQSALLECMEEKQITVDGKSYDLPFPFMVIATQNPLELQGTFPLPEAQLDRFFISLKLGYPSRESELSILNGESGRSKINAISSVSDLNEIRECMNEISQIHVAECIKNYLLDIVEKSRNDNRFELGISPRGSIDTLKCSKVIAAMDGRNFVMPEDIILTLPLTTAHRIVPSSSEYFTAEQRKNLVLKLISEVKVPKEELWKF